ncbi:hypothetical protein [Rhizobium sp.]
MRLAPVVLFALLAVPALAQEKQQSMTTSGGSMGQLVSEGYEIKAAVPNGKSFVVFLQKDSTAYACQVTNVSRSACQKID